MSKLKEFHYLDLDGEDMGPEMVEHGLSLLDRGEVTYTLHDEFGSEEITEKDINDPSEAGYFTLIARGSKPSDTVTIEFDDFMDLAEAIASRTPRQKRPIVRLEPPDLSYETYYRRAA